MGTQSGKKSGAIGGVSGRPSGRSKDWLIGRLEKYNPWWNGGLYRLIQVESTWIAECSTWGILQFMYFQPSLIHPLLLRSLFFLFMSGCFTQVLLYQKLALVMLNILCTTLFLNLHPVKQQHFISSHAFTISLVKQCWSWSEARSSEFKVFSKINKSRIRETRLSAIRWRSDRESYSYMQVLYTLNSEIFGKVLFSRNFAYWMFPEIKIFTKWQNHSGVYW